MRDYENAGARYNNIITGINMSSTFGAIYSDQILGIADEILNENNLRMLRALLANKILEVKAEKALQELRHEMNQEPIDVSDINPQFIERISSNTRGELVYADGCDFVTENEKKKQSIKRQKKY